MNGATDPGRGVLILVLGILGIVLCQILGPIAWILGAGDLKRIAAGQVAAEARTLTQVGMICGIIATVLLVLSLVGVAFFVLSGMAAGFSHR